MTRVNLQSPETLCDQHLMAEHREMKRIPNSILAGRLTVGAVTGSFVLSTGHVRFFTDKLKWLYERYCAVHAECLRRGFNVTWMWPDRPLPLELWNDWTPTTIEIRLSMARVQERMPDKPRWGGLRCHA